MGTGEPVQSRGTARWARMFGGGVAVREGRMTEAGS